MFDEIKHIKSNKKELISFGVTIGIIFIIISCVLFFNKSNLYQIFVYIAIFFIGIGLIIPTLLKPIYLIWMTFSIIIGWIMTRVIISLLFYIIVVPIGLILKSFGKDFLQQKKSTNQSTYWNNRPTEQNQNYENQF